MRFYKLICISLNVNLQFILAVSPPPPVSNYGITEYQTSTEYTVHTHTLTTEEEKHASGIVPDDRAGSKATGSFILYWKSGYVQRHTHGKKSKPGTHTSNNPRKKQHFRGNTGPFHFCSVFLQIFKQTDIAYKTKIFIGCVWCKK